MTKKKLTESDLNSLWVGAFRYYLGRMTISTHSFCSSLIDNWEQVPEQAQRVIKRDLLEEIKRDDEDRRVLRECRALGHDCDSQKWREVWRAIEVE